MACKEDHAGTRTRLPCYLPGEIMTIMEEMESGDNIDDELRDGAGTIADMWTNLSVTTANKIRVMQGMAPIDFPTGH